MEAAKQISAILCDGFAEDSLGEDYYCACVAVAVAKKLTVDQMNQLSGWLGIVAT